MNRFGIITNREDFLEALRRNRRLEPTDGVEIGAGTDGAEGGA